MDRTKYQVFVSSTYRELKEERRQVMQALLEMDCIPSGMELFPASSDEVWRLIESVIAEADYYVLIVGGRYGSTDADGVSYTEREYDLAAELGIPVLPFLHGDAGKIPAELSEMNEDGQTKLKAFRKKVESAHCCKYWTTPEGLSGVVSRALNLEIRTRPRIGWVRGDRAKTVEEAERVAKLQERVRELQEQVDTLKKQDEDQASIFAQDEQLVPCDILQFEDLGVASNLRLTWNDVFVVLADLMVKNPDEGYLRFAVARSLLRGSTYAESAAGKALKSDAMERIMRQFLAVDLLAYDHIVIQAVGHSQGRIKRMWRLTPKGMKHFARLTALKRDVQGAAEVHEAARRE